MEKIILKKNKEIKIYKRKIVIKKNIPTIFLVSSKREKI